MRFDRRLSKLYKYVEKKGENGIINYYHKALHGLSPAKLVTITDKNAETACHLSSDDRKYREFIASLLKQNAGKDVYDDYKKEAKDYLIEKYGQLDAEESLDRER